MRTNHSLMNSDTPRSGRALTPMLLALAAASACSGGIINPGGASHIWTGAVNTTWQNAGNWTTGAVPADGDSAIINGGPANIFLSADTAGLNSLYVGGGLALASNGHRIFVNQGEERTTITGLDSRLFLNAAPGGVASFMTNELDIESQGRLQMSGGRARVNQQLTLATGGSITGRGRIEVVSAAPVAFNGLGGDFISAIDGELEIDVDGGGAIAVPSTMNIVNAGSSLSIDAPFFIPIIDVNMDEQTTFNVALPWELAGILDYDGIDNAVSIVQGAEFDVSGSVHVNNGILVIEPDVNFLLGSDIQIGSNEELTISGAHTAEAASTAEVGMNAVLRIDGNQGAAPPWGGDIALAAGVLQVNDPQVGNWRLSGDLEMGSVFGLRSRIEGSASVALVGDVSLPGLGGEIDTLVFLHNGATMTLDQATTRLIVNDRFFPVVGSTVVGDGVMEISDGGMVRFVEPMNLAVDVENSGQVETDGGPNDVGYTYINGDYTQTATGRLSVDIAGPTSMQFDVYETAGDADLAGEIFIQLAGGYTPMPGESFTVFTANGTLSGMFDVQIGDPRFSVSYPGDSVVLTFVGCAADLTGDGVVDASDLASFLAAWGMPGATDFNGDGVTDASDLAVLLAAWGICA